MSALKELRYGHRAIVRSGILRFARLSGRYFVTDNAGKIVYSGTVFHIALAVARRHDVFRL